MARPTEEGKNHHQKGESAMRSYVILATWTDQGVKNSHDPLKRAKHFRALIESHRGKLREHLYTLGEYDIIMVTELPDDDVGAQFAGAGGDRFLVDGER